MKFLLALALLSLAESTKSVLRENNSRRPRFATVLVTVTNEAPQGGTCQTPPWVGVHDGSFDLYNRGEPTSPELERIAEDGNNQPIVDLFADSVGTIADGTVGAAPICPGETQKLKLTFKLTPGVTHYFSYATMILPSNDAFLANGDPKAHRLFSGRGRFRRVVIRESGRDALDAGTEKNDEVPENTAFFGQTVPDTGKEENGADFSIDGTDVGPYPADSIYAKDLGGGSAWCVLPYIVGASTMPFDSAPDRIAANGILPVESDGAGDLAMGMTMTFTHGKKKGAAPREEASTASKNGPPGDRSIASGVCGYLAESSERTTYSAKQGRIIVEAPAHCPTSATILRKSIGRGNGETNDENSGGNHSSSSSSSSSNTNTNTNTNTNISSISSSGTTTVTFPLPQSTPEIDSSGGIKLPNSMGFIYEAEAVRRLIDAKQITFPQWTPEESVGCLRIVEEMLRQVNQ